MFQISLDQYPAPPTHWSNYGYRMAWASPPPKPPLLLPSSPAPTYFHPPPWSPRPVVLRMNGLEDIAQQHEQGVGVVIEIGTPEVGEVVFYLLEPLGVHGPLHLATVDVGGDGDDP